MRNGNFFENSCIWSLCSEEMIGVWEKSIITKQRWFVPGSFKMSSLLFPAWNCNEKTFFIHMRPHGYTAWARKFVDWKMKKKNDSPRVTNRVKSICNIYTFRFLGELRFSTHLSVAETKTGFRSRVNNTRIVIVNTNL